MIVDNTILQCFNRCPRMYKWRHLLGLVSQEGSTTPLDFGSAIHTCLELWYKGGTYSEGIAGFANSLTGKPTDDKRNIPNGLLILDAYWKKWIPEKTITVKHIESAIQIELTSDIIFCGKVDLVVEMFGDLYVLDHKTASSFSNTVARPNSQFTGYIYALRVLGVPVTGAILNLIAVLKTKQDFHRVITTRQEWELTEWKRWVCDTKQLIDIATQYDDFPKYTHSCWQCGYKELCNSGPESLQTMIDSKYKQEKWEPWVQPVEKAKP